MYSQTDQENLIDSVVYEAPLGKSDHVVLRFELLPATQQLHKSTQVKFNYYKADNQSANGKLERTVGGEHS